MYIVYDTIINISYLYIRLRMRYVKDNLSDILVFNLGNVPGFHLIRAKVGGIFKLKFHTTYRNMIIYSARLIHKIQMLQCNAFRHLSMSKHMFQFICGSEMFETHPGIP